MKDCYDVYDVTIMIYRAFFARHLPHVKDQYSGNPIDEL